MHKLSDHMATFSAINFHSLFKNNTKYITTKSCHGTAITEFMNDLNTTNWENVFDNNCNADPQITYDDQFSRKLEEAIDTHFPTKTIKFNKYKHKKSKWITTSILNKIKYKDKLYKTVHFLPPDDVRHTVLDSKLQDCTRELRAMIKNAKHDYYHREFEKHKNDIKKTWETVREALNND